MNGPTRPPRIPGGLRALLLAVLAVPLLAGCASLVSRAGAGLGRDLGAGVLNQDDPQTVADGLPAYLLLVDGLLTSSPDNADLLLTGATLNGAYAGSFAPEPERRKRLALKAEAYARRAACLRAKDLCAALGRPYEDFMAAVARLRERDVPVAHALAVAWAGVLQADPSDWERIADLPRVEALLLRTRALSPRHDGGSASMYLGVLNCLRPESLGGKPRDGIRFFEEALSLSDGRNQMARVLDAEYCARLLFDQERHDALLAQALQADPAAPGLMLVNTLAQRRARELQESAKDYF
jgi:hypothetical protein